MYTAPAVNSYTQTKYFNEDGFKHHINNSANISMSLFGIAGSKLRMYTKYLREVGLKSQTTEKHLYLSISDTIIHISMSISDRMTLADQG